MTEGGPYFFSGFSYDGLPGSSSSTRPPIRHLDASAQVTNGNHLQPATPAAHASGGAHLRRREAHQTKRARLRPRPGPRGAFPGHTVHPDGTPSPAAPPLGAAACPGVAARRAPHRPHRHVMIPLTIFTALFTHSARKFVTFESSCGSCVTTFTTSFLNMVHGKRYVRRFGTFACTFGTFRHRAERVRQVGTRPPHSADRAARPRPAGNPTGSKTGFLLPPGTVACFQRARVCTATHRARPAQLRATPAP